MPARFVPSSFEEAAATLRDAAADGRPVRVTGGGSKLWGAPGVEPELEIQTGGLDRILEHNAGDLTAVLEAGVPLARAQQRFASAGQMLALDPVLGHRHEATIGGILATADTGYNTGFEPLDISPAALAQLQPGAGITLAVHVHQTFGGQGVDLGLANVVQPTG